MWPLQNIPPVNLESWFSPTAQFHPVVNQGASPDPISGIQMSGTQGELSGTQGEMSGTRGECAVCFEPLRHPRTLPRCGHTMDVHCLILWLANSTHKSDGAWSGRASSAPCPCCRAPFRLEDAIDGLSAESRADPKVVNALAQIRLVQAGKRALRRQQSFRACGSFTLFLLVVWATAVGCIELLTHWDAMAQHARELVGSRSGSTRGGPSAEAPPNLSNQLANGDPRAVRRCEGWLQGIGPPSLDSEGRDRSQWHAGDSELAGSCALGWHQRATRALEDSRAHHAVAHARKALTAAASASESALRPLVLYTLARAVGAAGNGFESSSEAEHLLTEAATAGHAEAQILLATRHEEEGRHRLAVEWYERGAAGVGDGGQAWRRLGTLRLTGAPATAFAPAVPIDLDGAATAFRAASLAGDAEGAYNLGRMYELGQVSTPLHAHLTGQEVASPEAWDPNEAAMSWLELAASPGHNLAVAHAALARLLRARGPSADAAKACEHLTAAARAGDADSQWDLASMLFEGTRDDDAWARFQSDHGLTHGERPEVERAARRWLAAAHESGHPAAIAAVSRARTPDRLAM